MLFMISYKASSSEMRPYQTSWVCFATRQELQQPGDAAFGTDGFPKRSVLPFFRCKFHWSPSNERRNVPSLVFTQSLLSCPEKWAQPRISLLGWCSSALESTADWEADRKSLQYLPERRGAHGTSSLLPRTRLNFLSLLWSNFIEIKRTGCTEGWNSWLPKVSATCILSLFLP